MTELHEANVPIEVFQNIFGKYGHLPDGSTGQHLAVDSSHNDREIPISKRVIWREELDSLCTFESIGRNRGHGAAVLLSAGTGCSVLIPPLTITHYRCTDGEQKLILRFEHAFLNNHSRLMLPADQSLDASSWERSPPESPYSSPKTTLVAPLDTRGHITELVGTYSLVMHRCGMLVAESLLRSARDMLCRLWNETDLTVGETRTKKLGEWASRATQEVCYTTGRGIWNLHRTASA